MLLMLSQNTSRWSTSYYPFLIKSPVIAVYTLIYMHFYYHLCVFFFVIFICHTNFFFLLLLQKYLCLCYLCLQQKRVFLIHRYFQSNYNWKKNYTYPNLITFIIALSFQFRKPTSYTSLN